MGEASRRAALLAVTLGSFLTPFMGSSLNTALPTIASEFGLDAVATSWLATVYLLSSAIFLVPFGRLADMYGRKRVFVGGILVYSASSFVCAFSPSSLVLTLLRIPQGLGGAMIFGTGIAILTSVYPSESRGMVLGVNSASVYLGLSLGPFLGGVLTQHLSWRSIFLVNCSMGVFILVVSVLRLKGEWAEDEKKRLDLPGAVLYSLTLAVGVYGLNSLPETAGVVLTVSSILPAIAFVKVEGSQGNPMLNLRLFKDNRVFAFSSLAALMNYSASFSVTFLLSLHLQLIKSLSPQQAGLVLLSAPAVQAVFSPFAGRLSDRREPRTISSLGMGLTSMALLSFAAMLPDANVEATVMVLILLGVGLALFASPNTNAVMGSVPRHQYGIASSLVGTMRILGQLLSMAAVALVFVLFMGRVQVTENYGLFSQSVRTAFTFFGLLCAGGIYFSLARGKANS